MNIPPPQIRIEVIRRSRRCLVLGLISLLPILGLPVAAWVLVENWRIKRRLQSGWNPAASYLHWGCACASWGAGLSSLTAVVLGLMAAISNG